MKRFAWIIGLIFCTICTIQAKDRVIERPPFLAWSSNSIEIDKIVMSDTRYRAYVYINPSKMRVIKTTYSEDGISMDNVYYDNVMHICVYEGKKSLFASDITKQMFDKVVPADFLAQSILSDTKFVKVNRNGFHYQAVLAIPETSIYSVVNMEVSFKGDLEITSSK